MIVAAGLTPAWQQTVLLDCLVPGEVNRARELNWCASGKVINVARALNTLSAPSCAVVMVGGATGERIAAEFEAAGFAARWITTRAATRVCTTLLDGSSGASTEIVENAAAVSDAELDAFAHAAAAERRAADLIVLSGSLPDGAPSDYYARLLAGGEAPAILDGRGPELMAALAHRPLLVKPNRQELAHTVGRAINDDRALRAACRELIDAGAQWVLVTDGARPATLVAPDEAWRLTPPACEVVNAIGTGDCLTAALAHRVLSGDEMVTAARYALAVGSASATTLLPARFDVGMLDRLANQVRVERVSQT